MTTTTTLDCLEIDALLEMPASAATTGSLPYWNKAAEALVADGYAQVADKPRWRNLPNYKRTPKGDAEARRLMR